MWWFWHKLNFIHITLPDSSAMSPILPPNRPHPSWRTTVLHRTKKSKLHSDQTSTLIFCRKTISTKKKNKHVVCLRHQNFKICEFNCYCWDNVFSLKWEKVYYYIDLSYEREHGLLTLFTGKWWSSNDYGSEHKIFV